MTTETGTQGAIEQPAFEKNETKKGFPLLTVIQLVLLAGLIVLYVLFFAGKKQLATDDQQMHAIEDRIEAAASAIAYVRSEQLMEEYGLAKKMREEFELEQLRMENDLNRRQRTFQTEVESFQRSINAGTISMEQAQVKEQELMLKQQELIQLNDTYRERLATKEFEMNVELLEKISDFLDRYNKEAGYDYILGYSRGGGILHANPKHDITVQVLEKLNAEYKSSN